MKNCEIIMSGFGGQGILFAGKIIASAAMLIGMELSWLPSYGPEMRGGTANCHVRLGNEPIGSPIVTEPDILVAMNRPSLDKFENKVKSGGYIFLDSSMSGRNVQRNDISVVYVDSTIEAEKLGAKGLANMVMIGKMIKETGLFCLDDIVKTIKKSMPSKHKTLIAPNITAVTAGYEL